MCAFLTGIREAGLVFLSLLVPLIMFWGGPGVTWVGSGVGWESGGLGVR